MAEIFQRALLARQILHILPGRRSRNWSQGRDTFGSQHWVLDSSCSCSFGRVSRILTFHLLLVMKDFFFFFPFSLLHQKGPWASLSKLTSSWAFWDWIREGFFQLASPTPVSRAQPTSWCMQQNSAAPGHRAVQKCSPRWLHILSHSNPVIFQMTWGFESKLSSETASAAKFFLDSFGNDKKLPNTVIWVLQSLAFTFPYKVTSWSQFPWRARSAMQRVSVNRSEAPFYWSITR